MVVCIPQNTISVMPLELIVSVFPPAVMVICPGINANFVVWP